MPPFLKLTNTTDAAIDLPGLRVAPDGFPVTDQAEHYDVDDLFASRLNSSVDAGHITVQASDTDLDPEWGTWTTRRETEGEADLAQIGGDSSQANPLTRFALVLYPGLNGSDPNMVVAGSFAADLASEGVIYGAMTAPPVVRDGSGGVAPICQVNAVQVQDVPVALDGVPGQLTYACASLDGTDLLVATLAVTVQAGDSAVQWTDMVVTNPIGTGLQWNESGGGGFAVTSVAGIYVVTASFAFGVD